MNNPREYTKDRYHSILTTETLTGEYPPLPRTKVAIIGAGISGLVAGWLLSRRLCYDVKIFEASNRVGGRIRTLREPFSSGLYAEAGAMRIPENHKLTIWLADFCNLQPLRCFNNESDNNILFVNNRPVTRGQYKLDPKRLDYNLEMDHDEAKNLTADKLFEKCLNSYLEAQFGPGIDLTALPKLCSKKQQEIINDFDNQSLRTFLFTNAKIGGQKLSEGARESISTVMGSEMQMSMSMAEIVSDYTELHGENMKRYSIKGGMDLLPKGVMEKMTSGQFPVEINYNSRVIEIRGINDGVSITYENPITRDHDQYECHFLILALPFSALRHVYMPALLTPRKNYAIRQLHYQNSCKIFIEFSQRFWTEEYGSNVLGAKAIKEGGHSMTDMPVRQIYYPIEKHLIEDGQKGGVLLASYTWGDDSLRWTSLNKDDRIRLALRDLAIVHNRDKHPDRKNALEKCFVGGTSHSWTEDEFTSGAFANFEPHQLTELFDAIWKPDGRIHFCGEHTSMKHAWIEGAVESAIRVSVEIAKAASARANPNGASSAFVNLRAE